MTYPYERFDQFPDYIYGRSKTPTASVLEARLAAPGGWGKCCDGGFRISGSLQLDLDAGVARGQHRHQPAYLWRGL